MNKTYICSDIHGDLPGYLKLLKTIEFDDTDCMIIAGDVLDAIQNQINTELISGYYIPLRK